MNQYIHRTAVFTLHHPTRQARVVMDCAFTRYTAAYTIILHHFSSYSFEELHAMATIAIDDNGEQITHTRHFASSLFDRNIPAITAALAPLESSMRESLKVDIASNLMSYIELSLLPEQTPSYPSRLRDHDREPSRQEALAGLQQLANDLEEENALRDQLSQTRQSPYRPILFSRLDYHRNCGLFYNMETRRFYARLFLEPRTSPHAKRHTHAGTYIDVRTGVAYTRKEDVRTGVESFGDAKGAIFVPLEMGRWHEQPLRFTETAFLPQRGASNAEAAKPVSATLVKHGDDYQLHMMFRLPKPQRLKPQALLGVDRGINCLAAGAVLSLDGHEVQETFETSGVALRAIQRNIEQIVRIRQQKGKVTKGETRRATIADQHVSLCANQIVELALKYSAQVVMEELKAFAAPVRRPKGKRRSNFARMLNRRQYQKLQDIVNAKLELVGLPPVRTVHPACTSITCARCGHIDPKSRSAEDRTLFNCRACGYSMHADQQAGVNIARKLLWISLRSKEKQQGKEEKGRTPWSTFAQRFAKVVVA